MYELRTTRQVEFADTDMAGLVHFSRFFVFMESVEHAFLRQLGTTVHFQYEEYEHVGWPRVAASCRYVSPARMEDVLDIHLLVRRKGRTSMTYRFLFHIGERLVAEGEISCICCALGLPESPLPIPIPPFLADQIEEAPVAVRSG